MPRQNSTYTPVRKSGATSLNAHLAARCLQLAQERKHPEYPERKISEVWDEERAVLRATPIPFDGFAEKTGRISATSLVNFERKPGALRNGAPFKELESAGRVDAPARAVSQTQRWGSPVRRDPLDGRGVWPGVRDGGLRGST